MHMHIQKNIYQFIYNKIDFQCNNKVIRRTLESAFMHSVCSLTHSMKTVVVIVCHGTHATVPLRFILDMISTYLFIDPT